MLRAAMCALVLLIAGVSHAGSWVDCSTGAPSTGFTRPLNAICFEWTAADLSASTVVHVPCSPIDLQLTPSTTDTSTGATAYAYRCTKGTPGSAPSAGSCIKMLVDGDTSPMDGVTAGREGQQYQTAKLLYVSPQAGTAGRTARLMISCQ